MNLSEPDERSRSTTILPARWLTPAGLAVPALLGSALAVVAFVLVFAGSASAAKMSPLNANGGCYIQGDTLDVHASELTPSMGFNVWAVASDLGSNVRQVTSSETGTLDVKVKARLLVSEQMDVSAQGDFWLAGDTGSKPFFIRQPQFLGLTDPGDDSTWVVSAGYWVVRPYALSALDSQGTKFARIRAWGLRKGRKYYAHMLNKRGKYTGTTYGMSPSVTMKNGTTGGPCSWATRGYDYMKAYRKWGTPVRAQVDASRAYKRGRKGRLLSSVGATLAPADLAAPPVRNQRNVRPRPGPGATS